jgi:hypothetical protein
VPTRLAVQSLARAGAVTLLTDYAAAVNLKLQVYPARPRSIYPPTAFVDVMRETLSDFVSTIRQRVPVVEVVVLHGLFDSKEAADQRDEFVDGFLDWVADNFHAFGPNTLVAGVSVDDEPAYTPDWPPFAGQPPGTQTTYYATRITLEGFAAT